jgi:agmatine/peptidylarginine deiminase
MKIIEILSSIFGVIMGVVFIYQSYKHLSLHGLMTKLVDKSISTKWHRRILWVMNIFLRFLGLGIKREYIKTYRLHDRGKIAVFKDLCDKNDIEPTEIICKKFLNYDSKEARDYYYSKRNISMTSEEKKAPSVETLPESQTSMKAESTVYLSDKLPERYPQICKSLTNILKKHNVNYTFIKGTRDIWCRDYMPIQTKSGKLIQFRYEPSYLEGKQEYIDSRSDVHEICEKNHLKVEYSDINLDGGNVLICDGRAILSDRIYDENKEYKNRRDDLRKDLAQLLECEELIIIPSLNKTVDFTGHADGMMRFVNRDKVLVIKYDDKYKKDWWKNTQRILETNNISYVEVPFFEDEPDPENPDSAIGVYVNYLEVNDLIVLPVFDRDEDNQMISILQEQFPNKTIEKINYNEIAKKGGLLNCTTWVMRK